MIVDCIDPRPVTEVALAVIVDAVNQCYLMGSRPAGKPYAGYWEFPGGKIEPGESISQALARELREELDLEIHCATPWFVLEYNYPHAYVRLHYMRVTAFSGEPRAMESQQFRWFDLGICDPMLPMLPMNEFVIKRLALPPVMSEGDSRCAPRVKNAHEARDATLQNVLFAVIDERLSCQEQLAILTEHTQRAPLYASVDDVGQLQMWLAAGAQGVVLKSPKKE